MKIFRKIFQRFADAFITRAQRRHPDFIIGGHDNPYLLRWWLIPRNPLFNIYLHKFLRDDDDRALHDHPWFWCSILLRGHYFEVSKPAFDVNHEEGFVSFTHRLPKNAAVNVEYAMDGSYVTVTMSARFSPGSIRMHRPKFAHRIELLPDLHTDAWGRSPQPRLPALTLFITGPRLRNWGFHCPGRGWVPWQQFTAADDAGAIGKGCDA